MELYLGTSLVLSAIFVIVFSMVWVMEDEFYEKDGGRRFIAILFIGLTLVWSWPLTLPFLVVWFIGYGFWLAIQLLRGKL